MLLLVFFQLRFTTAAFYISIAALTAKCQRTFRTISLQFSSQFTLKPILRFGGKGFTLRYHNCFQYLAIIFNKHHFITGVNKPEFIFILGGGGGGRGVVHSLNNTASPRRIETRGFTPLMFFFLIIMESIYRYMHSVEGN